MVTLGWHVTLGWVETRWPEDGEWGLTTTPVTVMTPWDCPQVRYSSCLMMDLERGCPAPYKNISLLMGNVVKLLTVIGQCNAMFNLYFHKTKWQIKFRHNSKHLTIISSFARYSLLKSNIMVYSSIFYASIIIYTSITSPDKACVRAQMPCITE